MSTRKLELRLEHWRQEQLRIHDKWVNATPGSTDEALHGIYLELIDEMIVEVSQEIVLSI